MSVSKLLNNTKLGVSVPRLWADDGMCLAVARADWNFSVRSVMRTMGERMYNGFLGMMPRLMFLECLGVMS
jgi:hypothetical protein